MAKPARQRETLHIRAIYRYHPMFAGVNFSWYYGADDASHLPASVEGGDVPGWPGQHRRVPLPRP
jgi:arginine deiminase